MPGLKAAGCRAGGLSAHPVVRWWWSRCWGGVLSAYAGLEGCWVPGWRAVSTPRCQVVVIKVLGWNAVWLIHAWRLTVCWLGELAGYRRAWRLHWLSCRWVVAACWLVGPDLVQVVATRELWVKNGVLFCTRHCV